MTHYEMVRNLMASRRDAARKKAEFAAALARARDTWARRAREAVSAMQPSADRTTLALELGRCVPADDAEAAEFLRGVTAHAVYRRRSGYYDRDGWERVSREPLVPRIGERD